MHVKHLSNHDHRHRQYYMKMSNMFLRTVGAFVHFFKTITIKEC